MKTFADLIAALRVEIGLNPDDDSQDAWLTARANSVLASMRNYTRRWLWPASQFRDVFMNAHTRSCCQPGRVDLVVLAEIPVQQLLSIVEGDVPQDVTDYEVLTTGRLFRNDGTNLHIVVVRFTQLLVDYVAGYVDLPADLYDVFAGTIRRAWSTTAEGSSSDVLGVGNIAKLTVFDVGSVELGDVGGFYESEVKAAAGGPILGPWAAQLDYYRDLGRGIGLPTERDSVYVGPAPTARATAAA